MPTLLSLTLQRSRRAAISNQETPVMPSKIATAVKEVLAELESLGDEKRRQFNAKTGRDGIAGVPADKQFGCKTGDLRKLAKKLKTDHELGQRLWKDRQHGCADVGDPHLGAKGTLCERARQDGA